MTREEKIELLNKLLEIEEKNDIGNLTRAERGEFQQWVEALEQEPVLDKIRAEIENINTSYYSSVNGVDMTECADDIKHGILQIIDKYKTESED